IDGAAEHLIERNEPMTIVEEEDTEHLIGSVAQLCRQEVARGGRGFQCRAGAEFLLVVASRKFQCPLQNGVAPRSQRRPWFGGKQAPQASGVPEQAPCCRNGVATPPRVPQQ